MKSDGVSFIVGGIFVILWVGSFFSWWVKVFLVITGVVFSSCIARMISNSSISFRLKVYFNFILIFTVFFLIYYTLVAFLDGPDIGLLILPIRFFCAFLFLAIFIASIFDSRKRGGNFYYSLKFWLWIIHIVLFIFIFIVCYNPVVLVVATSLNDEGVCDLIFELPTSFNTVGEGYLFPLSYKSDCFKGIAISKEDEKICDKIGERYGEYDNVWEYPFICHHTKVACYVELAVKKNDIDICIEMKERGFMQADFQNCFLEIAAKRDDPDICTEMEEHGYIRKEIVNYCFSQFG